MTIDTPEMIYLPSVQWQDESNNWKSLAIPQDLIYYRIFDHQDQSRNISNARYAEVHNFGSAMIIEFGFDAMSADDFFKVSNQSSPQHFFQSIKQGKIFKFQANVNWYLEGQLLSDVSPGSYEFDIGQNYDPDRFYYALNQSGRHEVFKSHPSDWMKNLFPACTLSYESGDYVRSWGYFPRLLYIGGDLNEGYDDTGVYWAMHIKAQVVAQES